MQKMFREHNGCLKAKMLRRGSICQKGEMFRGHYGCQKKTKCSEGIAAVVKQKMLKGHDNCPRAKMVITQQAYTSVDGCQPEKH